MSRSGYSEDSDDMLAYGRYRAQVASATRGKRGQALLRDMLTALDAMPVKRLIKDELVRSNGEVCALGACGARRGVDLSGFDPEDGESVGHALDVAPCLAREVTYINDEEGPPRETPEQRWTRVRQWVAWELAKEAKRGD